MGRGRRLPLPAALRLRLSALVALFVARALESLLFEVEARDPLVFAAVAAAIMGVALAASYVPAR